MTIPTTGVSDAPEPRRLTPTERLHEVTMAAMRRAPRVQECTVDLTLNAKGEVQIAVGLQGPADEVARVGAAAEAEFDRLCAKFPRAEPTDADEALKQARKAAAIHANRAKSGAAA